MPCDWKPRKSTTGVMPGPAGLPLPFLQFLQGTRLPHPYLNKGGSPFKHTNEPERLPPRLCRAASQHYPLLPLIVILDADDIILADIGSGLDFDQFERNLPLIGKPM